MKLYEMLESRGGRHGKLILLFVDSVFIYLVSLRYSEATITQL